MPARSPVPSGPAVLHAEAQHLRDARTALAGMRERTAGLRAEGGDRVSTERLAEVLHARLEALRDDPEVPLFFGRLDYAAACGAAQDETLYVGRRHVTAEAGGEPLVIDWRAGMSRPFYRARSGAAMGVHRRRRFGFSQATLTAYEDEVLDPADSTSAPALVSASGPTLDSAIVESEIERPRTGPMRDIVATIQPEQDVVVRADLSRSLCVQGAPGTGKTAVGLHRVAFLLYTFREQLRRSGVLVVGPNEAFLSYIGDVLPTLGEIDAAQATVASLLGAATGLSVRGVDPVPAALVKGDARMAEVLHRAVWSQLSTPRDPLVVPRGAHQWRVPAYLVEELTDQLRERGVRYEAGRTMLAQRLAHQVLLRMETAGQSPDDRTQNAVARSREVRRYAEQVWPPLDAARLVWSLLGDPDRLAAAADGVLTRAEQQAVLSARPARTPRATRWSVADLALVDEVTDLLNRTPSLGHVILDEAQDLSAMMLRAVGRRASTGSMTVLGDLAQATTPWATRSWPESLTHLGQADAPVTELVAGFRVPAAVIEFAARLLPAIAPTLTPPHSVRRSAGELDLRRRDDVWAEIVVAVREARARAGTVGVIVTEAEVAAAHAALAAAGIEHTVLGEQAQSFDHRVELIPAALAKGLEFDHVVVAEPADLVAAESDEVTGLRRLYVCLTRAVTSLVVVHASDLPAALR